MIIDIGVERNSSYQELIIKLDNTTINSGLLDEEEAIDTAKELIYAAEALLPAGYSKKEQALSEIRENL